MAGLLFQAGRQSRSLPYRHDIAVGGLRPGGVAMLDEPCVAPCLTGDCGAGDFDAGAGDARPTLSRAPCAGIRSMKLGPGGFGPCNSILWSPSMNARCAYG